MRLFLERVKKIMLSPPDVLIKELKNVRTYKKDSVTTIRSKIFLHPMKKHTRKCFTFHLVKAKMLNLATAGLYRNQDSKITSLDPLQPTLNL